MARNELLMENLSVHIRAGKGFEISISKSNSTKKYSIWYKRTPFRQSVLMLTGQASADFERGRIGRAITGDETFSSAARNPPS